MIIIMIIIIIIIIIINSITILSIFNVSNNNNYDYHYCLFRFYLFIFLYFDFFIRIIDNDEVALQCLGLSISRYRDSLPDPLRSLVQVNLAVPSFLLEITYFPTQTKW